MIPTRLVVGALEESGDPNGEKAERGPGAIMSSGFGGLGLEGMVGMSEPAAGVGKTPPGEGSSGAMSGDSSWKGDSEEGDGGGSVNVAGEDESVGTLGIGSCEYDERRGSHHLSLTSNLRLGGVKWGTTWQDSIG
ncbi:hypothetical protein JHK82_041869 [Glycine max]|nr:hypothetical protein JHK82_041869 [Glycine max]KAG5116025.1 hypothetical protein JHK84_042138 [Glycine max]